MGQKAIAQPELERYLIVRDLVAAANRALDLQPESTSMMITITVLNQGVSVDAEYFIDGHHIAGWSE